MERDNEFPVGYKKCFLTSQMVEVDDISSDL